MTEYTDIRYEELRQAKIELERVGERLEGLDNANVSLLKKIFNFPSRWKKKTQRELALGSMARRISALCYLRPFLKETTPEAYEAVAVMSEILADNHSNKRLPKNVKTVYTGLMEEIKAYKASHLTTIADYLDQFHEAIADARLDGKPREEVKEEIDSLEWMIWNSLPETSEKARYYKMLDKHDLMSAIEDEAIAVYGIGTGVN